MKLFETTGDSSAPIATELDLNKHSQKPQQLDACLLD
jgi:hypothetical protein